MPALTRINTSHLLIFPYIHLYLNFTHLHILLTTGKNNCFLKYHTQRCARATQDPAPAPSPLMAATEREGAPLGLWYAVLGLYCAALFLAITMPRGPKLHFPSEVIYSEKTLLQTTSKYEDNVDGMTGACDVSGSPRFWVSSRVS